MKPEQHSQTADLSAAARASHLRCDRPLVFEDPLAIHITTRRWRWNNNSPALYRLVVRPGGITWIRGTLVVLARVTEDRPEGAICGGIGQHVILDAVSAARPRPEFADCLQAGAAPLEMAHGMSSEQRGAYRSSSRFQTDGCAVDRHHVAPAIHDRSGLPQPLSLLRTLSVGQVQTLVCSPAQRFCRADWFSKPMS
jgi:hypothetical protein